MKKLSTSLWAYFLVLTVIPSFSFAGNFLFKDFSYGTKYEDIQNISGVYDCSDDSQRATLCIDDRNFAGVNTSLVFNFYENILIEVTTLSKYSTDAHIKWIGAISSKFDPIFMISGEISKDLIKEFKTRKNSDVTSDLAALEQKGVLNSNLNVSYIEKVELKRLYKDVNNITELLEKTNRFTRAVELIFTRDETGDYILAKFHFPNAALALMQKNMSKKHEDF